MSLLLAERDDRDDRPVTLNPSTLAVLRTGRRHMARSMLCTALMMLSMALLGALLTGCGGGDPEPECPLGPDIMSAAAAECAMPGDRK